MNDRQQAMSLIAEARALTAGVAASASRSTRRQYSDAWKRMIKSNRAPENMARTRGGYFLYRAAWVFGWSQLASHALAILDDVTISQQEFNVAADKLAVVVASLKRHRPDPELRRRTAGVMGLWPSVKTRLEAEGGKIKSHSKRLRLRGLPQDWRTRMFHGLRANSMYLHIVSVLSATGARPAEFEPGIEVSIDKQEHLHFVIRGAKTAGGKYGQEVRSFSVRPDRPELQHLLNKVKTVGGKFVVTGKAGAISDRMRTLSLRVFPSLKTSVSAYCFRHQWAADAKDLELLGTDVSAALGHCVDVTAGKYGTRGTARSWGGISNVVASRRVRLEMGAKLARMREGLEQRKRQVPRQSFGGG